MCAHFFAQEVGLIGSRFERLGGIHVENWVQPCALNASAMIQNNQVNPLVYTKFRSVPGLPDSGGRRVPSDLSTIHGLPDGF